MAVDPLIAQLRESHSFQTIMDGLLSTRPIVQKYTPQKTIDETAQLTEQIKYSSGQQSGWDNLYQALTGQRP